MPPDIFFKMALHDPPGLFSIAGESHASNSLAPLPLARTAHRHTHSASALRTQLQIPRLEADAPSRASTSLVSCRYSAGRLSRQQCTVLHRSTGSCNKTPAVMLQKALPRCSKRLPAPGGAAPYFTLLGAGRHGPYGVGSHSALAERRVSDAGCGPDGGISYRQGLRAKV